jgi:23S rRNA pseudouridine1911/1915/1917 synthase
MKHFGHPLFNDARYGGDAVIKGTSFSKYRQFVENCFSLLPRQALHAKTLGFTHPKLGRFMQFDSELPDDFVELIDKWRNYAQHKNL